MATEQLTLAYPIVEQLDISKGVYDIEDLGQVGLDPDQRQNLPMLVGRLGIAMAEEPRERTVDDRPLQVAFKDIQNSWATHLKTGLVIEPTDKRFEDAEQLIVVGRQQPNLALPGVVPARTGVVFPVDEFDKVARNAHDLVKHVRANTRRAGQENPQVDRDELSARAHRSAAHMLRAKHEGMQKLDSELIEQRLLMARMYRDSKHVWRTAYLAKNLNRDRKAADELIHRTAETATVNLELDGREVRGIHRAIVSELYRRGSSSQLALNWQRTAIWVGRHLNAKRGKIQQSMRECEIEFAKFSEHLEK